MPKHISFSTFLLWFTLASTASAITSPTLPQYQVNTDLSNSPVTGKSIPVASGGDIQAAINSANPGDEIVLQAGGTWIGQYVLPNKGPNSAWITIRSSAVSSLPAPGTRVAPQDAANMPKIMAQGTAAAFTFATKANHYRLIGLEITEQPAQYLNYGLILQGDPNDPDPSDLPSYITVDRCYIHGDVLSHIKFGWQMNGAYLALIDSYVSEMHGIGQDAQAVTGYMGTGPLKINNNFLEGAGENVIFGGAYDAIPNTTTADVTFTNNYLYKPMAWQNTIVPQPNLTAVNGTSGGTLAPGTYYYAVIAQGTAGTLTDPGSCQSSRSNEVAVTMAPGQSATSLQWNGSSYGDSQDTRFADSYVVLRSQDPPGAPNRTWTYYVMTPPAGATTLTFTDNGSSTQTGFNEWPRYWDVKNLMEIKNGVRWLIDSNVMEGNWFAAQNGFSILFTPRNETPFMPGNRISDMTFSNNVVRHVAGGINLASEDDLQPPANLVQEQATARMAFVGNLFEDVSTNYGGVGVFAELQSATAVGLPAAHDLLFDHNTIFQNGNVADITMCCGTPLENVTITNNVFGEGTYGWFVNILGQSYNALAQAMGGLTFSDNVWAGNPAVFQFAGNYYPATLAQVGFVNYNNGNGGDYHLAPGSPYKGMASDGTDPGVNMDVISNVVSHSIAGAATSSTGTSTGGTTSGTTSGGATSSTGGSGNTAPSGGIPAPVSTTSDSAGSAPQSFQAAWFAIANVNSGKCLTMQADWRVAQYPCAAGNPAQMFRLAPVLDSNGSLSGYEIYNRNGSGLGFNVWGNTANNGAVIGMYQLSGQPNEIFSVNPDHAGNFTLVPKNSGSCFDITGVSKQDGALLQQWSCTGHANQLFDLVLMDTSTESGTSLASSTGSGAPALWFVIPSVNSGKCLTAQPNWTVEQYTCTATNTAQMFRLSPVLDGSGNLSGYEIYSRNGSGLGLNVWGNTPNNGALIGLYPLTGQPNELFTLNADHAGNFTVVPKNSGSCSDITGVSKDDGALLQQYTCNGQTNQSFNLALVDVSPL